MVRKEISSSLGASSEVPTLSRQTSPSVPANGTALVSPRGTGGDTALDRALAILDYLATTRNASPAQLAEALGLSRSTTYRIMDRLRVKGYIDDIGTEGSWRLGPSAARLALSAIQSSDVAQVAPDFLRVLVQQTRESIGLGIPRGEDIVFIYRDRGPQAVAVNAEVGARRPMYCTSVGKAYLAALYPDERSAMMSRIQFLPMTKHTIMSAAQLEADIERTIARGWSEDRMELDPSSTCCGAPIFNHAGTPVAAISVAGVTERMTPLLTKLGPIVAGTAEAISRRLGYDPAVSGRDGTPGLRLDYADLRASPIAER